jgi:2-polyprenyl-3-methyl-5-hydroxy-6-metoxy-1,4-benzoquinol methylase
MSIAAAANQPGPTCVLEPLHAPVRRLYDVKSWSITRCEVCGLIMTGSAFDEALYQDEQYYTIRSSDVDAIYEEWGFRWRWAARRLGALRAPGRLLDVGAGNGLFVKITAEEFGWMSQGLEQSAASIRFARSVLGVELDPRRLEDIDDRFDVVTGFNLLEHVTDPVGLLRDMAARVEPGGLVVVTTPSPACIHARIKGLQKWGMVSPPHHINIFSRRSLELAFAKAGLSVVSHQTISTYIRALRRLPFGADVVRTALFELLRSAGLGGDHFAVAVKV